LLMIAEQWGIEQDLIPGKNQTKQIAERLRDAALFSEIIQALPQPALTALTRLMENSGKLERDSFEREFGSLREMGAARREKVRPDQNPLSITENLYYKGLIGQAFFSEATETRELVFIPDEFREQLVKILPQAGSANPPSFLKRTAVKVYQTDDFILDHTCSLLSALRAEIPLESLSFENPKIPAHFLMDLLMDAKLIKADGKPNPEKIRRFLEADRAGSFSSLAQVWLNSTLINETSLLGDLEFEGGAKNDALLTRKKVVELMRSLPEDEWLGIKEFIARTHTQQPDFLRTGGEYESWLIKNTATGQYMQGFKYWEQIEGAFLHMMINGPLFWMGMLDLGVESGSGQPDLFRRSKWFAELTNGEKVTYKKPETVNFILNKDGSIIINRTFPLTIRYQISRFCDWEGIKRGSYVFRLSHSALQRSLKQGLQVSQLVSLITKYGKKPVPSSVLQALERWEKNQLEAYFEKPVLLRVRSPKILDQLLSTHAKEFIINRLNDHTAIVNANAIPQLKNALMDLGILSEIRLEV